MDNDKQAIIIGLGAGLGGFVGLLFIGCICWQIFCGSWCEKKDVPKPVVPTKNQRRKTMDAHIPNNISTMTPMRSTNLYSDSKSSTSNDLAGRIQLATRR